MRRENLILTIIKLFVLLIFLITAAVAIASQAPNWTPISATQYNMVAFGDLYVGGLKVTNANYTIGAFGPGGISDCRGVCDTSANGVYYLTIVGDTSGQTISFKIYDKTAGTINDIQETSTFADASPSMEGVALHATVAGVSLNIPTLSAPADGATGQPVNVTLSWADTNSSPQESGYKIRIKASGGSYTEFSVAQDSTSYAPTGLSAGVTYSWSIMAVGNGTSALDSAYPTDRSFTTVVANVGNISGRVSVNFAGHSDLGVGNAVVSLQGTSYTVSTDTNGNFILQNIPFGNYTMLIVAPNMNVQTQNISVIGGNIPVTFTMPISGTNDVKGDTNGDKRIGLEDSVYILQILSGERR